MIITKDNIVLVDNDIYILKDSIMPKCEGILAEAICITRPVLASTNHSLEGVKHLDRNLFVKKVDVEELAKEHLKQVGYDLKSSDENIIKANTFHFKAGYNAKEGEFTNAEMMLAIKFGAAFMDCNLDTSEEKLAKEAAEFINSLRPLSIPESIELDDEFNVVNVKW